MRIACIVLLAAAALGAQDVKELGAYVGVWQSKGVSKDSAYSKAGNDSAETDCNWAARHAYLVCDQLVHTAAGTTQNDLSIYTYNEKDHAFAFVGISRNESRVRTPKLTIEGKRWTYSGQFDDGAKHIQFRTVNEFTSPTTVTYLAEYSEDATHWTLMSEGVTTRVK